MDHDVTVPPGNGRVQVPVIGFLSDFGHADPYVGICHGVMARIAPGAHVIDICHEIPPGNIRVGAAVLAQAVPYLPAGVVVGVVDPGVGTRRRAIVVTAGDSMLVGPDNGLLLWGAEALGGPAAVHEITNPDVMLSPVSRTFHGRDVFSPVAAHLAVGVPIIAVGPDVDLADVVRLPDPVVRAEGDVLEAEVLTVDRYGNLQTAAPAARLRSALTLTAPGTRVLIAGTGMREEVAVYGETFGSVPPGDLVVYEDSAGLAAVAINGGRAQERLSASAGAVLHLRRA